MTPSARLLHVIACCAIGIAATAAPSRSEAAAPRLQAGAAIVDITPETFPVIVNGMFTERTAAKAADRLHSRALVLDDGSSRLAMVVVDTCMMPRDLIDRAKNLASAATKIPEDRIMVSATHTHSAPASMACLGSRMDEAYAKALPPLIARSIKEAAAQVKPARIGWAIVDDWKHTFNRRWVRRPDRMLTDPFGVRNVRAHMHPGHQSPDAIGPSGPVDPALTILSVQRDDGKPLAVLANYSQHYYGSEIVSSDYFGRFAVHLAKRLGADDSFVGIMSQGTSGDLMWMDYGAPRNDIGYDAYAAEMAKIAADRIQTIEHRDFAPLAMKEAKLTLRFRVPDAKRLAWARETSATVKGRLPQSQPEIYAFEQIHLHERPQAELKLQAIRIGDLGFATIPNEVFAITGLKIKAQSPLASTTVIELANGAEGYIPPPEQHALGGYTTWPARTAGLEPQAEPQIAETLLKLLEEVAGQSRRTAESPIGPYAQAVLASQPTAYWRLEEFRIPQARDASAHGHHAIFEDGVALFLHGAEREIRVPPVSPSPFTGDRINRGIHCAGGRLQAGALTLGESSTLEFWFWNGLPHDARPITGYLASRGPEGDSQASGDHLGIGGSAPDVKPGRLFVFNGNDRKGILAGRTEIALKTWNHVAMVRQGSSVKVYLNGRSEPEISGTLEPTVAQDPKANRLVFGGRIDNFANFEGKLDEIAVYDRALSAEEIQTHFQASSASQR